MLYDETAYYEKISVEVASKMHNKPLKILMTLVQLEWFLQTKKTSTHKLKK